MTANNYNYTKQGDAVKKVTLRWTKQNGVVKKIFAGWTKRNGVVEQVYKKQISPYKPGQVLYDSSTNTAYPVGSTVPITLYAGDLYEIEGVGGGGASCGGSYQYSYRNQILTHNFVSAGGSGSAFKVRIQCNQTITDNCTAGPGGAVLSTNVGNTGHNTTAFGLIAYAGYGGRNNKLSVSGGTLPPGGAGVAPSIPASYGEFWSLVSTIYTRTGNAGQYKSSGTGIAYGGAAVGPGTYGKGADATLKSPASSSTYTAGNNGYLKITYIGPA